MNRLLVAVADFNGWSGLRAARPASSETVIQLDARRRPIQAVRIRPLERRARPAALAAALVFVLIAAGWAYRQFSNTRLYTHEGERREVTLEDGSVVRLSSQTELRVTMQPQLRSIALERGEAMFRVVKDPRRPFIVSAPQARVQAVGTVFAVARNAETVVVTVREGSVSVLPIAQNAQSAAEDARPGAIALQANERISISSVGVTDGVRRVEPAHVPQWDDAQLVFENQRVADVVSRFNQRNRVQIRVTDEALAARKVSGIFDADDPQSFVAFLITVAGAKSAEPRPEEIVVIAPSTGAASAEPAH